jgi:hypothetical protein
MPKNIARIAIDAKTYMMLNPSVSCSDVAVHFQVSRARISQMLKIANNLPAHLLKELVETDDPALLRQYYGKCLLKMVKNSWQKLNSFSA